MSKNTRQRLQKVVLGTAFFLALGLLYALIVHVLGLKIPCVFHAITGLRCPGCGITSAMMALLHGEFVRAVKYNYAMPAILGYIAAVYLHYVWKYVRTGKSTLSCGSEIADIAMLVLFVAWAVVRNIFTL